MDKDNNPYDEAEYCYQDLTQDYSQYNLARSQPTNNFPCLQKFIFPNTPVCKGKPYIWYHR